MPFQGAGFVGVLTEGVALVYYGAARWAAQSSMLNTQLPSGLALPR